MPVSCPKRMSIIIRRSIVFSLVNAGLDCWWINVNNDDGNIASRILTISTRISCCLCNTIYILFPPPSHRSPLTRYWNLIEYSLVQSMLWIRKWIGIGEVHSRNAIQFGIHAAHEYTRTSHTSSYVMYTHEPYPFKIFCHKFACSIVRV